MTRWTASASPRQLLELLKLDGQTHLSPSQGSWSTREGATGSLLCFQCVLIPSTGQPMTIQADNECDFTTGVAPRIGQTGSWPGFEEPTMMPSTRLGMSSRGASMRVRELEEQDAFQYRALRPRALKEHPTAFSSSYEQAETVADGDFRSAAPNDFRLSRLFHAWVFRWRKSHRYGWALPRRESQAHAPGGDRRHACGCRVAG